MPSALRNSAGTISSLCSDSIWPTFIAGPRSAASLRARSSAFPGVSTVDATSGRLPLEICLAVARAVDNASSPLSSPKRSNRPARDEGTELRLRVGLEAMGRECTLGPVTPADQTAIERFVRVTLGCRCPDEVFQSIAIERVGAPGEAGPLTRLLVGNRLLIYLLERDGSELPAGALEALCAAGRADRDRHGLNRFRLVVGSARPDELRPTLRECFGSAAGADDRAHLHVLAPDQVRDCLGNARAES